MATILIVDDRLLNREFLMVLLGKANYRLLEAKNGEEAIKIAKTESINLIITDILMPRMDGIELVEQLRKDPELAKIPVVFYTATYGAVEAKSLAESCGVKFVIPKPCEPQIILEMIRKALGESKAIKKQKAVPSIKTPGSINLSVESLEFRHINKSLSKNFSELEAIKQNFKEFFEKSQEVRKERNRLLDNIEILSEKLKQVEKLSNQLVSIMEFNSIIVAESDPEKLIRLFCRGTRRILEAKYAVIGIFNEKGDKLKHFLVSGMDAKIQSKMVCPIFPDKGFIGKILKQRVSLNINQNSNLPKDKLFPNHPMIKSFLGLPIFSKNHLYGFIYFADKKDGNIFNEEDSQIANTLTSEFATLFENFEFYDAMQRHAYNLQLEVLKRKRAQELFRQFGEIITDVFWHTNLEMDKVIYISPAYEEVWGKSVESCYANPHEWFESIIPEDQSLVKETFEKLKQGEVNNIALEFKITRPDGIVRNLYTRGFQLKDKQGNLIDLLGVTSDITDYQKFKEITKAQTEILSILKKYNNINLIFPKTLGLICESFNLDLGQIWMIDPKGNTMRCIDTWQKEDTKAKSFIQNSFKISFKRGIGLPGKVWKNKKSAWISDLAEDSNFSRAAFAKEGDLRSAFASPILYKNTVYGVVEFFSSRYQNVDPELLKVVENTGSLIGEFIHRKHTEDELKQISHHDILTGLMNRSFFEEEAKKELKTSPPLMAFIILDIDRFKLINEAMEHDAGDLLLQAIADRLRTLKGSLSARVGADKFVLALTNVNSISQINDFIIKIQNLFKDNFIIKNKNICATVSLGGSIYPEDGSNISTLLQKAEIALQQVKEQGGNHFQFCSSILSSSFSDQLLLENDLRKSLKENQFCLYYQPKVDLKTGNICGLEALIRWQHPEKGLLTPAAFIHSAEELGLIVPIGEWVLNEVFSQLKNKELFPNSNIMNSLNISIAVNLSIYQLRERHNLITYIEKLITEFDINPKFLELEITESVLAENVDSIIEFLNAVKKLGIKIALDDFGTGYSSLKYLQSFAIDRIKIDKSFVDGVPHDPHNKSIVKAIIALAHNLNIKVIAEGVETIEQLQYLVKENCDEMQGYYFSKPKPAAEIKEMITEKKHLILTS